MATSETGCGSSSLPNTSIIAAPASGSRGISQIRFKKSTVVSPLQQVDLVGQDGLFVPEEGDQDAQADRGFRHRVGNDEDCEDLAVDVLPRVRKRDQVDIDGVQDQLDRHQDN